MNRPDIDNIESYVNLLAESVQERVSPLFAYIRELEFILEGLRK